jgi:hypothetical protein
MKKTLLALALVASSFAASAITLGLDYGYTYANGAPYAVKQKATPSLKESFWFGDLKASVGTTQSTTSTRDNGNVFGLKYSYNFATPAGRLAPDFTVQRSTGTRAGVQDTYSYGVKLYTPVFAKTVLVTEAHHAEGANSNKARSTEAGLGFEYKLTNVVTAKGMYQFTREQRVGRNIGGAEFGVEYKF